MLKHRNIDKICWAVVVLVLVIAVLFTTAASYGWIEANHSIGYENRLFDTSGVHTIDILMDDWDGFIETAAQEEYSSCTIIIDGEKYGNVGIRAKGNTSLSQVAAYGNDRYSFKIEFDQYSNGNSYYGLDKLSLNNIIQDNTYLKDYLTYQMMNHIGIAAPLSSYAYITVNGEDWGLYLAVEAVEDGFLQRNYGNDFGELYKPDSMNMGGGRGNGIDFNMDDFTRENDSATSEKETGGRGMPSGDFEMPDGGTMPDGFDPSEFFGGSEAPGMPQDGQTEGSFPDMGGGMGQSDVMLQYIDDDPDSYPNIFENAKTDITDTDQVRLIESLKKLSESETIEDVVDVENVIKYLVVHDFVQNSDSYTGSMVHNYYLYEENGVLSMVPWDYNLAFGGFAMGSGMMGDTTGATSTVNAPIDTPVSGGTLESRPMVAWIFESEEYVGLYHQYYAEFMENYFDSGYFEKMMDETVALISPYIEKDPTAFFSYDEFLTGVKTLREFSLLRAESISGQISGSIPSTQEGQRANSTALVDASHISTSDMGSMVGMDMGSGFAGRDKMTDMGERPSGEVPSINEDEQQTSTNTDDETPTASGQNGAQNPPGDGVSRGDANIPEGFDPENIPEGGESPFGQNGGEDDTFLNRMPTENVVQEGNSATLILVLSSILILTLGIIFAFNYRRRK